MITENVLKEWYTENASRRMPLATLVPESGTTPSGLDDSGQQLPNSLLVGLQMLVPRTMLATREAGSTLPYDKLADQYRIYIKTAIVSLNRVDITFATVSGAEVARAVWTPTTEMNGLPVHGVAIAPLTTQDANIGSTKISGFIFLGPDADWKHHLGIYRYTGANIYSSMVSESCISCDDAGRVTGLVINGIPLYGEITFVAGNNARVDVDQANSEISLSFAGDLDEGYKTRDELVSAIVNYYGDPVLTINTVCPNGEGNFTVSSPDNSMSISEVDHGITITSLIGQECCDKDALTVISSNTQALNAKVGRLQSFLQTVASNINALQNELAYLKMTSSQ